jgi:hypothetical protein
MLATLKFALVMGLWIAMNTNANAQPKCTGFYDRATLLRTQDQMRPGIEENLREVILPMLTLAERRSLSGVALAFPLELGDSLMNFYADLDHRTIHMPVCSLRFLRDIVLAYAWLHQSGHSLQPVTDYLAMLRSGGRERFASGHYRPLEVLGIPDDALRDPRVEASFQRMFGTAVVFALGHELGHLFYGHGHAKGAESQQQEADADRFALELMRRVGDIPVGIVPFFMIAAHLEAYVSDFREDTAYSTYLATTSHPASTARLLAVADHLVMNQASFSRSGTRGETVQKLATEIRQLVKYFADPTVQTLVRQSGFTGSPESLGGRNSQGSIAPLGGRQASTPFSGSYRGKWQDASGTDFDIDMTLQRNGDGTIRGFYTFGTANVVAGKVEIEGIMSGSKLFYNWKWGRDYFGKGVLEVASSGRMAAGTWGYNRTDVGAGTLELTRVD